MPSLEHARGPTRIVIYPPTVADGNIAAGILADHQIECCICQSVHQLCDEARAGVGVIIVAEEHLLGDSEGRLREFLASQSAWSDIPLVILTSPGEAAMGELRHWHQSASITLLPRPVAVERLVSVARSRIRDRKRQYVVKRLLSSLEDKRREFEQLANAMPQVVFISDQNGQLQFLNERARHYHEAGATHANTLEDYFAIHSQDRKELSKRWRQAQKSGARFSCEFRARRDETGKYRWQLARAEPVRGDNGTVSRWYGTCTDIHDQKLSEQALDSALSAAQAASVAKSEFLANMSHEIRTPMTAILGYAQLLDEAEADAQKRDWIEIVRSNGEFLLELINDILDLSKIESGKLDLEQGVVSLRTFLSNIQALLALRAEEKGLRLSFTVEQDVVDSICTDARRLRQVLVNLLGNAIKFTDQGAVSLLVKSQGGRLLFVISDTGIGISKDQLEGLFEPFNQADASVSRRFGGSGLGLAISQRLAGMLGGSIEVESVEGQGSVFTLQLESAAAPASDATPAAEVADGRRKSPALPPHCSVVVIDDRRDVRFLTGHILSKAGAEVTYAEDGKAGVQLVTHQMQQGAPPDIVLMDMQMPVMDGYRATEQLRAGGYAGPIIALTADAMHGDMDECLECGCNAYLSKPIDKNAMLRMIAEYTAG